MERISGGNIARTPREGTCDGSIEMTEGSAIVGSAKLCSSFDQIKEELSSLVKYSSSPVGSILQFDESPRPPRGGGNNALFRKRVAVGCVG